jgi:hypothetical protein
MANVKKWLPMLIAFCMGVFFALQFYVPQQWTTTLLSDIAVWMRIIGGLAMGLAIVSLFRAHIYKIKRKAPAWGFSIIVFISLFTMVIVGIICKGTDVDTAAGKITFYGWLYQNLMVPLQSTMFSILAFYIASAAFKAFRAKTREATILLIAAIIVMFGRVPMGEEVWQHIGDVSFSIFGLTITLPPAIGDITGWIMNVPNMAAQGGIGLGICLGSIAMSLKIIFGIERPYMGGGK